LQFPASPPTRVILEQCAVEGSIDVESHYAAERIAVKAPIRGFVVSNEATFRNADLTDCRIVGNRVESMTFADVKWPTYRGRVVIRDEVVVRMGVINELRIGKIREAYETLKGKYQAQGSQRIAGEFHYGEMEMRRHDQGNLGSILCWEYLYWLLSGYGTRPVRALSILAALTLTAAVAYWGMGGFDSMLDALRFSIANATLQRPEADKFTPAMSASAATSWIQVFQAAISAIQIALFVLALRMRLKR
jgi:hypothetical protein